MVGDEGPSNTASPCLSQRLYIALKRGVCKNLDARIREVHLVIEVRQVVFACPFADLVGRPIRRSVVVVMVLVVRM